MERWEEICITDIHWLDFSSSLYPSDNKKGPDVFCKVDEVRWDGNTELK